MLFFFVLKTQFLRFFFLLCVFGGVLFFCVVLGCFVLFWSLGSVRCSGFFSVLGLFSMFFFLRWFFRVMFGFDRSFYGVWFCILWFRLSSFLS